jgi:hypothetical protein
MIRDERLIRTILQRVSAAPPGEFDAFKMIEEGFDPTKLLRHIDHLIATGYLQGSMLAANRARDHFITATVTGLTPQGRALLARMTAR